MTEEQHTTVVSGVIRMVKVENQDIEIIYKVEELMKGCD